MSTTTTDNHDAVFRQLSVYHPLTSFELPPGSSRSYRQQFADIYFLRLAALKPVAAAAASTAWDGFIIAGEYAKRVGRVLDVRQGELCWLVGTVYVDLPLKPDVLADIAREHWSAIPPPRATYRDQNGTAATSLEDESGRLRLVGAGVDAASSATMLVTGAVVAVLGTENARGDFEVVDIRLPELPPEPPRWAIAGARNDSNTDGGNSAVPSGPRKIALLSGLELTGTAADMVPLSLLTDYLLGYQTADAAVISRLIIAGNSIAVPEPVTDNAQPPHHKKYGHDAAVYNPSPITRLDSLLAELLPSIPVTVMSGESDPANASLPQQPIHRAMLPRSKPYCAGPPGNKASVGNQVESPDPGWLDMTTNPLEAEIDGWRFWGCSGQNVDDVLRYLDVNIEEGTSGTSGDERLRVMEAMLRWRCPVPTAPDTLWCYPFQDTDPFVLSTCPHVFFIGNQPRFATAVVEGSEPVARPENETEMVDTDNAIDETSKNNARVRLISLPRFRQTGELVLLDADTLDVEIVRFGAFRN